MGLKELRPTSKTLADGLQRFVRQHLDILPRWHLIESHLGIITKTCAEVTNTSHRELNSQEANDKDR